jgi:hypothetical protein
MPNRFVSIQTWFGGRRIYPWVQTGMKNVKGEKIDKGIGEAMWSASIASLEKSCATVA